MKMIAHNKATKVSSKCLERQLLEDIVVSVYIYIKNMTLGQAFIFLKWLQNLS